MSLQQPAREGGRALLVMLLVVYLALLTWIVLWKLEVPHVGWSGMRDIKLIPFGPTARNGASEPLEVAVNVLLFVPFGLYLRLLSPSRSWRTAAWAVTGASLALEVAQYVLAVGSSDISDVLANAAGGLVGIGLFALARRTLHRRTATVLRLVCSVGTALALLAIAGIVVTRPVRFARPDDVPGPSWCNATGRQAVESSAAAAAAAAVGRERPGQVGRRDCDEPTTDQ